MGSRKTSKAKRQKVRPVVSWVSFGPFRKKRWAASAEESPFDGNSVFVMGMGKGKQNGRITPWVFQTISLGLSWSS